MAEKNPFKSMAALVQSNQRIVESLGIPFTDPFNEEALIADVNDPKKLGRVKVKTDDGSISDWINFPGSNKGTISARYIGAKVLVGKSNGRSENMYVIGVIRNDPEVGISGSPVQLPILDESLAQWNSSTDPGMKCNEGNAGRAYILSNEMNQELVVCIRRSSNQTGSNPSWAWASVTGGLWVEKGFNPGNSSTPAITQSQNNNPGVPECTEALLGEVHEFSEDRKFRTTQIRCKRDEDGKFAWEPGGSTPVFFRTTLPNCEEKIHGMGALLDDGGNSEFIICQRYQGKMSWTKQGKREPIQFHTEDLPLSKKDFLATYRDIPELEEKAETSGFDWATDPEITEKIFDTVISAIPLTGTDPKLRAAMSFANLIPQSEFNTSLALSNLAREAMYSRTGVPVNTLFSLLQTELQQDGKISYSTSKILSSLGGASDFLINGARFGTQQTALNLIGRSLLQTSLTSLDPKTAAVMVSLMGGGVVGALDATVALGLDKIPDKVSKYISPIVGVAGSLLLSNYSSAVSTLVNASVNGGLLGALGSAIARRLLFTPQFSLGLAAGQYGPVGQLFSAVVNLSPILKLQGNVPLLMTTALGSLGQIDALMKLFGNGGLGLDKLNVLLGAGFSAASLIVGGIGLINGLLGPSGSGCPCDPRCRKTSHGVDSDGNKLLEKCGSLPSNTTNSYSPTGNPLVNNLGPIALSTGLSFTGVGQNLIPPIVRDLTLTINTADRIKNMGQKVFASKNADLPEKIIEEAYTAEAVEKAFKMADNNITRVESVEKKLIDTSYNILSGIVYDERGGKAVIPELIRHIQELSVAVQQIYSFVEQIDKIKDGPNAGVRLTPD